jgi:cysteinyl-tRNA synthetase
MHNGHLTLDAEKMSKSLGNIVRIRDILKEVPGEALRLLYLDTHYRAPLPYSTERLAGALAALDRLYTAKETALEVAVAGADVALEQLGPDAREAARLAEAFPAAFDAAMDEDFDTHAAITSLMDLVRAINRFANDKKQRARGRRVAEPALRAFAVAAEVLGIGAHAPAAFFDEVKHKRLATMGVSVQEIEQRIAARANARASRDWALADAIRDDLDGMGIVVMDTPAGSTWRMRVD